MRIQHNITALNAHRQLGTNQSGIAKNLEKLSSGYRINRAGDDAAGLAISEKMRSQIKGLETASKNAQDGISLVQTAEGALTEVHSMLNRMTELATQSANGTYQNETDRENLQKELDSLRSEVDRIAEATDFNGIKLLDGKLGGYNHAVDLKTAASGVVSSLNVTGGNLADTDKVGITVSNGKVEISGLLGIDFANLGTSGITVEASSSNPATGAGTYKFTVKVDKGSASALNYDKLNGLEITVRTNGENAAAAGLGFAVTADSDGNIGGGLSLQVGDTNDAHQKVTVTVGNMGQKSLGIDDISIADQDSAGKAIEKIKAAINQVSSTRGDLGAIQNRLEHTINNLGVTAENMTAAESRIRDVDMAKEMMEFTKNNILSQAATSMLAQANQTPQGVLQLLQ